MRIALDALAGICYSGMVPPRSRMLTSMMPFAASAAAGASDAFAQPDRVPDGLTTRTGLSGEGWENRVRWIHIGPEGEWLGHSNGPFALTRELFVGLVARMAQQTTPRALDYGHGTVRSEAIGTPGGVRASGYALTYEVRPNGLWALCELTRTAVTMVTSGELRFCSGVFLFGAVDGQSGENVALDLHSIALTSTPFIDGQEPIALDRASFSLFTPDPKRTRSLTMPISIDDLAKLLKTKADANGAVTADVIEAALKLLAAGEPESKAEGDLGAPSDAKPAASAAASRTVPAAKPRPAARAQKRVLDAMPPPAAGADPLDALEQQIMTALGITDESSFATLLGDNADAVIALLQAAMAGEPTDAAAIATSRDLVIEELRGQVKVLTDERTQRIAAEREAKVTTVTASIDAAIAAGQIVKERRAKFVDLARKSPELAAESIDAIVGPATVTAPDASKVLAPGARALERSQTATAPSTTGVDALVAEGMRALGRDAKGAPLTKPAAKA